jgi:hypothetical protein
MIRPARPTLAEVPLADLSFVIEKDRKGAAGDGAEADEENALVERNHRGVGILESFKKNGSRKYTYFAGLRPGWGKDRPRHAHEPGVRAIAWAASLR